MKKIDREAEAKAALKRLDQQSEKILGAAHSDEPAEDDRIEILGKRIARIISVILAVVLIFYLWRTYFTA